MESRPTEENANHGVELESYPTHSSSETGNLPSLMMISHSQHFLVFSLRIIKIFLLFHELTTNLILYDTAISF